MHHKPAAASSSFSSSSSSHLETESAHFLFPSFLPSFVLGIIYVPAIFFSYPLPPSPRDLTGSAIIHLVDKNWGLFPTLSPPPSPHEKNCVRAMWWFALGEEKNTSQNVWVGVAFEISAFFLTSPNRPIHQKRFPPRFLLQEKRNPFAFFYTIFFLGGGERGKKVLEKRCSKK